MQACPPGGVYGNRLRIGGRSIAGREFARPATCWHYETQPRDLDQAPALTFSPPVDQVRPPVRSLRGSGSAVASRIHRSRSNGVVSSPSETVRVGREGFGAPVPTIAEPQARTTMRRPPKVPIRSRT